MTILRRVELKYPATIKTGNIYRGNPFRSLGSNPIQV